MAFSTHKLTCHILWGDHPVGKGGRYTFNFFLPHFLFTLDLQQVTATATLQFPIPGQRKEVLCFVRKSLPLGAWRYNSTLILIYFIAPFTVFRFNYCLLLLQKGNFSVPAAWQRILRKLLYTTKGGNNLSFSMKNTRTGYSWSVLYALSQI